MRIGYIILCRYGSTRLPGKILKEINQKPLLQYIYERIRYAVQGEDIIVATGKDPGNQPIVDYCYNNNIPLFLGEQDNVAKRFLDCMEENRFDFAARINGDNLFVSPQIIRQMVPLVRSDRYDLVSNVKGRTFPPGMSVEYVRTSFFHTLIEKFNEEKYREHVTLYLYEHEDAGRQYHFTNQICQKAQGHNFAIDTGEDFKSAKQLLLKISSNHTDYDICDWIAMSE